MNITWFHHKARATSNEPKAMSQFGFWARKLLQVFPEGKAHSHSTYFASHLVESFGREFFSNPFPEEK
jgi:hypothetical protein